MTPSSVSLQFGYVLVSMSFIVTVGAVVGGLVLRSYERSLAARARAHAGSSSFSLAGLVTARKMLSGHNGVHVRVGGEENRYEPSSRILVLSSQVARGSDCASIATSCHEAGHALWHSAHPLLASVLPYARLAKLALVVSWMCSCGVFFAFAAAPPAVAAACSWALLAALQVASFLVEMAASRRAVDYLCSVESELGALEFVRRYLLVAAVGHLLL